MYYVSCKYNSQSLSYLLLKVIFQLNSHTFTCLYVLFFCFYMNNALLKYVQEFWLQTILGKTISSFEVIIFFLFTPVTGRAGPEGSRKLRLPDFMTTARYGGRLSASRTGRLYPKEYSWYSFSLGAESTPGPRFRRKEICH